MNEKALTKEQKALTSEQKALTSEQKALTSEQKALTSEQKAVTSEQKALTSEQKAVTLKQKAVTKEQKAVTLEQKALTSEQKALTSEQKALTSGQKDSISTEKTRARSQEYLKCRDNGIMNERMKSGSPVLLLGDTVGTAGTGLLYLASYLRRNGIEAYCQWNDTNDTLPLLKENIERLLGKIRPRLVGVSMKWFPHMVRVFEICKIIKSYNPHITVVVGGNTASYFHRHIIGNEYIDYVVLGDGEKPLLDICSGKEDLPNCTYKKNGKINETPITYVHDAHNTSDIYLSHLDEIFVSPTDIGSVENFYINTGKGCSLQCFYCAGGIETQKQSFNRQGPFIRGIDEVRKDLLAVKTHTGGFMFDFDLPLYDTYNSFDYYKKIWEGMDLSRHGCEFYSWMVPSPGFIGLVKDTFGRVFLSIDMCSLSEPHRLRLASLGLVKPQPTDREIFDFFDTCEQYGNVEVQITPILGLPYFSGEDIKKGKRFITYLIDHYSCFSISWGRLHAQPGALLPETARQYDMHSYAAQYRDFLYYSRLNLEMSRYPGPDHINYPYIYFNDSDLNMKTGRYYVEINKMIGQHRERYERKLTHKRPRPAAGSRLDEGDFDF